MKTQGKYFSYAFLVSESCLEGLEKSLQRNFTSKPAASSPKQMFD